MRKWASSTAQPNSRLVPARYGSPRPSPFREAAKMLHEPRHRIPGRRTTGVEALSRLPPRRRHDVCDQDRSAGPIDLRSLSHHFAPRAASNFVSRSRLLDRAHEPRLSLGSCRRGFACSLFSWWRQEWLCCLWLGALSLLRPPPQRKPLHPWQTMGIAAITAALVIRRRPADVDQPPGAW